MADAHGTIRILITSIDGNITHPFKLDETVDDVRKFGYDKLVKDKGQIPFNTTWIELSEKRLDGGTQLSKLVETEKERDKKPEKEPDLTLTLAWTQQGGLSGKQIC